MSDYGGILLKTVCTKNKIPLRDKFSFFGTILNQSLFGIEVKYWLIQNLSHGLQYLERPHGIFREINLGTNFAKTLNIQPSRMILSYPKAYDTLSKAIP